MYYKGSNQPRRVLWATTQGRYPVRRETFIQPRRTVWIFFLGSPHTCLKRVLEELTPQSIQDSLWWNFSLTDRVFGPGAERYATAKVLCSALSLFILNRTGTCHVSKCAV